MKIVILRNNLKNALDAVSHTLGDASNLPILKNILIKAVGGKIQICSTDLETAVVRGVAGKIIDEGSVTVPFSVFNSVIGNIQNERIDLDSKKMGVLIKTDNYEAVIQGMNPEDFPIIPKVDKKDEFFEINGEILRESLNQVVGAAQISELRPEISGILFDVEPGMIKFAATDSFRLAEKTVYETEFKNNFERGMKFIVPLKPIQEFLRIMDGKTPVRIYAVNGQLMIENGDLELISRLIEGQFPDYNPIIPKNLTTEISLDKNELIGALKLASAFTSKNNEVRLKITKDSKVVEVYSSDSLLGENKYLIPAKISGEPVEVVFNWRFLLDGLRNLESDSANIGLQGDIRPSVIKTTADASFFYIIMPIKS
ncbi:MAG: DNA polymerase III subunit beta [Candidatus Colwellbacteria bacterium]|nr:DNA polymerase III subunit beta [Candidatus Colwellbacteria bacterium]